MLQKLDFKEQRVSQGGRSWGTAQPAVDERLGFRWKVGSSNYGNLSQIHALLWFREHPLQKNVFFWALPKLPKGFMLSSISRKICKCAFLSQKFANARLTKGFCWIFFGARKAANFCHPGVSIAIRVGERSICVLTLNTMWHWSEWKSFCGNFMSCRWNYQSIFFWCDSNF